MFVLVGQVDRGLRGREAFQEVDLVHTIGGLAKWAGEIDDTRDGCGHARGGRARHGRGPPGPALISLPEDVLDLPIPEGTHAPVVRAHPEAPNPADVRAVLHFLAAEQPW